MNIRNNRADDDNVFVPRRQRSKYTELEERKMWWFFARELRAGNQDAVKRRPSLWKMYELQENTNKKASGLESHFRKYMIKKIHRAAMTKEDMCICLRFFKIRLNRGQQEWLEQRYGCDIDCDMDGTFRRAHFLIGTQNNTFPTAEEESTITANNNEEDEQDGGSSQENNDAQTPKEPAGRIQQKKGVNGEAIVHEQNDHSNSDSSDDVIIVYEKRKNAEHQQDGNGQHIGKIETDEIEREEGEQNEVAGGNGANTTVIIQIRVEEMQTDPLEEEAFSDQSQMDHAVADETRIMEENRRSWSALSDKSNQSEMTTRKEALGITKKAFADGTLAVFDGRMSARTFLDPFLYIESGKYEGFARGINWLVNDTDDQEPAYD